MASDTQTGQPNSYLQHLDELMAQALADACGVTGPLASGHIMIRI